MDQAKNLLNTIISDGYESFVRLLGQEENLFIDFKVKNDSNIPGAQGEDYKVYSKALSGFSNSSGGIIVWGVNCREVKDSADIAQDLKPIKSVMKFLTDLNKRTHQSIFPMNEGIENHVITIPNNEEYGFVITYIPESNLPPHRSNDHSYYARSGSSFYRIEHYQLADMFGKRQKPNLEIYYTIRGNGNFRANSVRTSVTIGIRNNGRYLAIYPAIRIKTNHLLELSKGYDPQAYALLKRIQESSATTLEKGYFFGGGINDAIHPSTDIEVAHFQHKGMLDIDSLYNSELRLSYYVFDYEIYAEGCAPKAGRIQISSKELV